MKTSSIKSGFIAASLLAAMGYAGHAMAYGVGSAVLDAAGNNASATDLASVNCPAGTHHLSAAVQDTSPAAPGLWVSLRLFKDTQMTTVTDTVSADGNWSPIATLNGGPGTYYLSVSKTNVGARNFTVGWECQSADNVGTGTDIQVLQIQ